jgi:hypothetical protein
VRRRWKAAIGVVSVATAAGGGLLVAGGPARADVAPGVGNAYAQAFQDTPKDGSLEVGVVLGESIAGHTNYVARALSQGVDLTAIGTSLQSYNCGTAPTPTQTALVPQPLQAETGQPGADQGFTQSPTDGVSSESSTQPVPPSFGSTEHVQATGTPYGEADTSYGSVSIPGVPFSVTGMTSKAWSGMVDGNRVAAATSDVGSVNFLNGAVVLDGLHWSVTYPSGGTGNPAGTFSIGSLTVEGQSVPTVDPTTALQAANAALTPLGIQLVPPSAANASGMESVSALEIDVLPNATRQQVLGGTVAAAEPATGPLESGLEGGFSPSEPSPLVQALCQSDTPITVADIAVASVDGGGSYTTSLGGVNATSGEAPTNPYNLSLSSFGSVSSSQFLSGSSAVPGTPGLPGTPAVAGTGTAGGVSGSPTAAPAGSSPSPAGSAAPTQTQQVSPIAAIGHGAGGPLLAIGLGGLAALALLAEGDRRAMRKAAVGGFEDEE